MRKGNDELASLETLNIGKPLTKTWQCAGSFSAAWVSSLIGGGYGFDWHSSEITRETPVGNGYRNTQNVRRFMRQHCGEGFRFDRDFMVWIHGDASKTMGDVVDHWLSTHPSFSDH